MLKFKHIGPWLGVLVFTLWATWAVADLTISGLQSATVPLPAGSCIPVSQGPGTDAAFCGPNYAAFFGLSTSTLAISDTKPTDPTGTTNTTTFIMMGFGAQGTPTTITPTATGTIVAMGVGVASNSVSGDLANTQFRYGTGTAPANGTFASGVATGSTISSTTFTVGTVSSGGFSVGQTLTGTNVTAGTVITANISGTGNGSTWTVSPSQTTASTTITGTMGVSCGNAISASALGASGATPNALLCMVTGLTISTAYWYDVSLEAGIGGTASIKNNEVVLEER